MEYTEQITEKSSKYGVGGEWVENWKDIWKKGEGKGMMIIPPPSDCQEAEKLWGWRKKEEGEKQVRRGNRNADQWKQEESGKRKKNPKYLKPWQKFYMF